MNYRKRFYVSLYSIASDIEAYAGRIDYTEQKRKELEHWIRSGNNAYLIIKGKKFIIKNIYAFSRFVKKQRMQNEC